MASRTERPSRGALVQQLVLGALVVGVRWQAAAMRRRGRRAVLRRGRANKDALTNPTLTYADDIEPLLDLYRTIGELAPLAVERDWNQLVTAYETASTVVPGDPNPSRRRSR